MNLRDEYISITEKSKRILPIEEGKEPESEKKVISDDAFAICDFIERLINEINKRGSF